MNRAIKARRMIVLGLVAATALSLAACGRRGALEAPRASAQPAQAADEILPQGSTSVLTSADGAPVESAVPVRREQIQRPDRPFILDKIL